MAARASLYCAEHRDEVDAFNDRQAAAREDLHGDKGAWEQLAMVLDEGVHG